MICAVLQRGSAIKSAGGYVRNLTEKARAGRFSLEPMLMALTERGSVLKRSVHDETEQRSLHFGSFNLSCLLPASPKH